MTPRLSFRCILCGNAGTVLHRHLRGWPVARVLGVTVDAYAAGVVPTIVGVLAGLLLALWLWPSRRTGGSDIVPT